MARQNTIEILIKAEDKASAALGKIGGSVQSLGKVALAGLAGVGTAAVGAGAALTKFALDAAPIEGVAAAFEGTAEAMGRSSDELLASLEEASSGMVSQADLMKSFNQAQMLVGDALTSQLAPAMGYLGKVSAATGEDMSYMMDSLVRGVGRLSPLILDNLGIQVDLTAANEAYAASVGKTVDELTKGEQQTALMNQVMEKLAENTANYPDVAGSAAAQIATLRTKFQNLKDTLGRLVLPILTEVVGKAADLADRVIPYLIQGVRAVAEIFAYFTGIGADTYDTLDDVSEIGQKLGFTYEQIESVFGGVKNTVASLIAKFKDFWGAIEPVVKQIWDAVARFVSWKDVLIALGVAIAAVVVPAVASLVASIAPLLAAGAALVGVVALVRNAWEKDWGGIQDKVGGVIAWLKAAWQTVVDVFEEAGIREAIDEIRAAFTDAWATLQPALAEMKTALGEIWAAFAEAFGGGAESAVTFREVVETAAKVIVKVLKRLAKGVEVAAKLVAKLWDKYGDKITKITKTLMKVLGKLVGTGVKNLVSVVKVFMAILEGDWEEAWKEILKIANRTWDAILDVTEEITKAIQRLLEAWHRFLERLFDRAWDAILGIVEDAWDAIERTVEYVSESIRRTIDRWLALLERLFETAWNAIERVIDDAWDAIERIVDRATAAIQRTIDSWLDALERLFETAWDAIERIIDSAWDAIERTIDTATAVIQQTIDSWLDALERLFETAWNAIKGVVNAAWSAIESIIDTATASIQSTINTWLDAVKRAFEAMWNSLAGIVETAMEAVRTVVVNALMALADIMAVGSEVWNTITGIGRAIADAIVAGVRAVADFASRVATWLGDQLSRLVSTVTDWLSKAIDIGKRIIAKIAEGFQGTINIPFVGEVTFLQAIKGLLWYWMQQVVSTATDVWNKAKDVGGKILNAILTGFGDLRDDFINWVRSKLVEWLGAIFSPIPEAQHMGAAIAQEILSGFASQRGAFVRGLRGELGGWMAGLGTLTVPISAAGGGLAMAGAGAGYNATFHTTINTRMEEEEFYYRVQEAIRRMG
jgi:phage-related protein